MTGNRDRHGPDTGGYRSSGSSRWIGLGGTISLYGICVLLFCFAITTHYVKPAQQAALTVLPLQALASPEEVPPQEKEAAKPADVQTSQPEPLRQEPTPPMKPAVPAFVIPAAPEPAKPADPKPVETETAAPRTVAAPPAPQSASGPDSWEGRVLAVLNQKRRYPRLSLVRREQGTPWIRLVMDRTGKILSVRLERSSGFAGLDHEALALAKRAQPLPKPPKDKPGETLELVVPIEFFMR